MTRLFPILLAPLALVADVTFPLNPKEVECVECFCYTGLVTSVARNENFILERSDGARLPMLAENRFDLSPGDIAEVRGKTLRHDNGMCLQHVYQVKRLGRGPLPPTQEVPLEKIKAADHANRRLKTEGTLVLARQDEIDSTYLQLILKEGSSFLNAALELSDGQKDNLSDLLGARLQVTGILLKPNGARKILTHYLSATPEDIKVVQPAPADIFDVPNLEDSYSCTPGEIRHLGVQRFEGVVLATWGGDQMMLIGPKFHRVRTALVRPDELPRAGDRVTVIGLPDTDLFGITLSFARCRPATAAPMPSVEAHPRPTTLRILLTDRQGNRRINGYGHGQLLRISGTVLDIQPSLQMFSLHDDGFTLPVDCSSSPEALRGLEANARVEVVVLGVVESDAWHENIVLPKTRDIRLVLRSADDLRVIARPPFWTPVRLALVIAALLVALIMVIVLSRLVNRLATRRKVDERTRLAVELHDSLSQTLAGVTCQIAAGRDAVTDDPKTATDLLAAAERMLESSRTELKNCLFDLRNNTVDDPDFAHAIERTLSIFRDETALAVRFPVSRALMTDSTAHAVLCIIRELVANAIRHGKAAHIRVAGSVENGILLFSVSDDGTGFDPARHPGPREGHFGLMGISERLSSIGGKMDIESAIGKTHITISLPL